MRRLFYAITLALVCLGSTWSGANAQLNIFWEEIGPNNHGNHVRGLTVDGSGNVWAGSVGGGLWKSTNTGATWVQVPGVDDNLMVSSIAVDGNKIYVGTGELYFYEPENGVITIWSPDSVATIKESFHMLNGLPGEGVFVSTDGGSTWDHSNGTWSGSSNRYQGAFSSVQKVISSGGRTLIGTMDGLYYSSSADLNTVTKATGTSYFESNTIMDVEFADNNVVIASTKDSVYRSTNNGTSFGKAINDSLPVTTNPQSNRVGGDRIEIAVAPSDPSVIYVAGASNINSKCTGVWRSTDNGINWNRIAPNETATFRPLQENGRYSFVLAVKPSDPMSVILGGEKLYKYDDANGWDDAASHSYSPGFSTNYVPTPILSLAFDPNNDSTYFVGTDAEIVRTVDYGETFSFTTKGFNNSSLFGVSAAPNWKVLASDRYNGLLYKDNGNSATNVQQFLDIFSNTGGGIARWSLTNPEFLISQTADGGLVRSLSNGATFESFYGFPKEPFHPGWGSNPDSMIVDRPDSATGGAGVYDAGGAPITPWTLDEYIAPADLNSDTAIMNTPAWLYMCSHHFVWVACNPFGTLDSVPFWNRISNNLVDDFFGLGKREYLTAITVSGDADHMVYVGTSRGKIYRILNANDPLNFDVTTMTLRVDTGQGMPERGITDIEFDLGNPNNLVVTFGSYAYGDDRVWITNDAKAAGMPTFRSIQGDLQADLPVFSAAFHPDPNQRVLVIGTDEGVYATNSNFENQASSINWDSESANVGSVPVYDVIFRRYYMDWIDATNYKYGVDYTMFIATHGRGVFKSASLVSRPKPTITGSQINMQLVPNPASSGSAVHIELPALTKVKIEAFSIQGQKVAVLSDRILPSGHFEIEFDTEDLPAGVYLVKAEFSNSKGVYHQTMKQLVVK